MTIGFDIDNTLVHSSVMINEFYKDYPDKLEGDSYTEMPERDRKKFLDIYLLELFKNVSLMDKVKEVFDYLHSKNHRVVIITRRGHEEPEEVYEITKEYLKRHNLKYHALHFNALNKGEVCALENVLLFVDDHISNLINCEQHGVKGVKFGGNKDPRFKTVYNWDELFEIIKEEGF